MANKYVWQGQTYNGDGTSSAAAASDGGVGAWNSLTAAWSGTPGQGTLDAGDTVYIRSKDASESDVAVSIAHGTTIGKTGGANWIVDAGTVWSGVSGEVVVTITLSGTSASMTFADLNNFFGTDHNLHFTVTGAVTSNSGLNFNTCLIKDCRFSYTNTSTTAGFFQTAATSKKPTLEKCRFEVQGYGAFSNGLFVAEHSYSQITLMGCRIVLNKTGQTKAIFYTWLGSILAFGGDITGVGAEEGTPIFRSYQAGPIILQGLSYPRIMKMRDTVLYFPCYGNGVDGAFGSVIAYTHFEADTRSDGYYPTLNAVLPDSAATPFSYRLYPSAATLSQPAFLLFSKLWNQTAAIKTITVEVLVESTMTVDASSLWAVLEYKDVDGSVALSSHDPAGAAMTTSTSTWSATTYGPSSFNRYKIALTTPTAIAQDTMINVTLFCAVASSNTSQILFVDPDVQLS